MPIPRGTRVVLMMDTKGALCGDTGKVSSRKKNGWLRITIDRTHETISVRNGVDRVGVKVTATQLFHESRAEPIVSRIARAEPVPIVRQNAMISNIKVVHTEQTKNEVYSVRESKDNDFIIVDKRDALPKTRRL